MLLPRDSRRDYFERLIFTSLGGRRFTQNSPVLPEVWMAYAVDPTKPQDLLLTPHRDAGPGSLALAVRQRLEKERQRKQMKSPMARKRDKEARKRDGGAAVKPRRARVAYNQFNVVCELYFDELARVVLPLSNWWQSDLVRSMQALLAAGAGSTEALDQLLVLFYPKDQKQKQQQAAAKEMMQAALEKGKSYQPREGLLDAHIVWMAQAVGTMALLARDGDKADLPALDPEARASAGPPDPTPWRKVTAALFEIFRGVAASSGDLSEPLLWNLQLNRKCRNSLFSSTVAVKADAARRVFTGGGKGQRWAILDSGIDATHMAFRQRDREGRLDGKRDDEGNVLAEVAFEIRESKRKGTVVENYTRVVKTYDFTLVRDLLSDPEGLLGQEIEKEDYPNLSDLQRARLQDLEPTTKEALKRSLAGGRMLDWEVLEKVIEVPHDMAQYEPPIHKHGTHVAGILGADWRSGDSDSDRLSAAPGEETVCQGICPRIQLYDLRVLDGDGRGDEFSINSALQWVRSLNQRSDVLVIHGVNLSLAIPHDMANFACGRTPVCEEAERLVGAGVVVVAAAGNRGKTEHRNKNGLWEDTYHSISITDPGNAEGAITVGATHKLEPHTYGVSYFSSRGPTGDGRRKPDLVAPGEKIWSTTPGNDAEEMDGTSQATPHVAGAAALLMQRYPELIGQPRKVKRLLCESATDLGREPYFQGAGMLDILRALQSF